ncbi:phage tail assembly protein [Lachnotalea glycerini]|uniref:Phage tail assembly protein n=1 Tax=Lachnotalea glycerini TaxID=1763509 RepID=A0A371J7L4_9FIRM|nr:phage tail assembly protein [Lachnotalea glycerini]RDY28657.1 phage tail assembly protein [Lachnotalea glycerini]
MKKENTEVVEVLSEKGEVIESELVVSLSKSYQFEGKTYDKIDLSNLEDLTAADMIAAQKVLDRSGSFSFNPELSLEYSCIMASKATGQPLEFFHGLRPKDALKVKNRVTGFFYKED